MVKKGNDSTLGPHRTFSEQTYSQLLDKVFGEVLVENEQLEQERFAAPDLLAELICLSPNQRQLLVRNSPQFQAWPLMEEALARCRSTWSDDPERAENFARLALDISGFFDAEGFRKKLLNDLVAEIWSHIGNCLRIRSDLAAAHEAFSTAERHLAMGTGDVLERARLLDLKSSLLRAERDFRGAAACLSEAVNLYSHFPDRHAEGRARLKQAMLVGNTGQPQKAIELLERAAGLIDLEREPRLKFFLRWNLVVYLLETERFTEAQRLLPEARELSRTYGTRHDKLRLLWVEGVLRMKLGQVNLAEEALTQVREGFIVAGIGYDVALVSLDLAALYLEAGRTEEVRKLAAETIPIFASRNVQRELLVAWQLFKDAAEKDVATLRLVHEVSARIRSADGTAVVAP